MHKKIYLFQVQEELELLRQLQQQKQDDNEEEEQIYENFESTKIQQAQYEIRQEQANIFEC